MDVFDQKFDVRINQTDLLDGLSGEVSRARESYFRPVSSSEWVVRKMTYFVRKSLLLPTHSCDICVRMILIRYIIIYLMELQ